MESCAKVFLAKEVNEHVWTGLAYPLLADVGVDALKGEAKERKARQEEDAGMTSVHGHLTDSLLASWIAQIPFSFL
jgi:hypothetical protein